MKSLLTVINVLLILLMIPVEFIYRLSETTQEFLYELSVIIQEEKDKR